ncbi:hypothetical protein F2P81_020526 [Scophthalmus maximus]|uniref:Uncharacterized protein n=1 Tax=Scophthalmus maximus TaxID=52904 RepID=A0A6A4S687_SCOMX|nr:hypothetical protein F2P81_020526 [Scophthalmus maximus]
MIIMCVNNNSSNERSRFGKLISHSYQKSKPAPYAIEYYSCAFFLALPLLSAAPLLLKTVGTEMKTTTAVSDDDDDDDDVVRRFGTLHTDEPLPNALKLAGFSGGCGFLPPHDVRIRNCHKRCRSVGTPQLSSNVLCMFCLEEATEDVLAPPSGSRWYYCLVAVVKTLR